MNLVTAHVAAASGGAGLIGLRLLLVFGIVLLLVAVIGWLRQTWRRHAAQQEEGLPELLAPPEETGEVLAAPLRGAYLGTTDAGQWLEWFSARGLSGKDGAYITVHEGGVRVDRGASAFWIPREAVRGARLERAHAGKVATPGRLLVIAWSLDGRELETGFRGEDRARQPKVMRSVHDLIGPPTRAMDGEVTSPRPVPRALRQLRPRRNPPVGAEGGVPVAARGRAHGAGTHQAASGRGGRPGRRGGSRTLQQEIADRRGADPYGTGPSAAVAPNPDPYSTSPRAAAGTGADPYVGNPRGVAYGAGAGPGAPGASSVPAPGPAVPGGPGAPRPGRRSRPGQPARPPAPGAPGTPGAPGIGQPGSPGGWSPAQGPGDTARRPAPRAVPGGRPTSPRPPAMPPRPPSAAPRPPATAPRPPAVAPPPPAGGQRPPAGGGGGAYGGPDTDGFSVTRADGPPGGTPWRAEAPQPGGISPAGRRPVAGPTDARGYDPYGQGQPTPAQAYPAPAAPPPDPYDAVPPRAYPPGRPDPSTAPQAGPTGPYAAAGGYPGPAGPASPGARDPRPPADPYASDPYARADPYAPSDPYASVDPYAVDGRQGGSSQPGDGDDPYDDVTRRWPRREH
ncbi:hypothetical protein [Pseudofrankia asymbiotica]|uniref:PH domain-containing protein n=1 Tax=Pseudofrankia asymbiotica TaxID=1834516 RepID=A0A1V2I9I5_9ACTN|nr:hypothetical protein [Pseudofrankia asymbiotica]ONH29185.1 hypothetical protein BL253_17415 [Pseudofrankia asymbiotica]